jgi:hypothetical protein
MKKFTVYLMTPYLTWEEVMAKDEDAAISQCSTEAGFDCNEVQTWLATSEDEED